MNRKDFLSAVIPFATILSSSAENKRTDKNSLRDKAVPPYLKRGDIVGICCPSGYISLEDVQPAVNTIREWGFEVMIGNSVGAKDFTYAGSDELRINDLQRMLDEPSVKAVMFGRGGYGAVRIIDRINFKNFAQNPKWIIGFSDATVFHSHLNKNFGIASIHSKMCSSFPDNWSLAEPSQIETIDSIRRCLIGETMQYITTPNEYNRAGISEGILIGGNLAILQNLAGTKSDIDTSGKILFIEEVEEYLYSIDRMLWNLKRTVKLDNLAALIVGGINKIKPDDPGEEFGKTVYEMVNEKVKDCSYPVCFDFPVGHQKNNYALKCGVKHRLEVSISEVTLREV